MNLVRIEKVYKSVIQLIKDRGYPESSVSSYTPIELIYSKINLFLDNVGSPNNDYLDIVVKDKNRLCVQFFTKFIDDTSEKSIQKYLDNLYQDTILTHLIESNDEIIYIFLDDVMDEKKFKILNEFENSKSNVRFMFYKSLLFSPVKHILVPHHTLYKGNIQDLFQKLMISSYLQLPALLSCDPICVYYNFKPGDIIEIHRKNIPNKIQKVYRYVKLFTGESRGKELYF